MQETNVQESVLLFPVPATPRYNQYQAVFFNFVLLKKNRPGNEASSGIDSRQVYLSKQPNFVRYQYSAAKSAYNAQTKRD